MWSTSAASSALLVRDCAITILSGGYGDTAGIRRRSRARRRRGASTCAYVSAGSTGVWAQGQSIPTEAAAVLAFITNRKGPVDVGLKPWCS